MAESNSQENRTIDLFGPQFLIETGSRAVGVGGQNVFNISSINDDGVRYTQSLTQTGLSKINAEGILQIESGIKNQSSEGVAFFACAHNGDMALSANKGWVRIKGRNIVLDATNKIVIKGQDIQIGNEDKHATERIILSATEIDAGEPLRGNIADLLRTSSIYQVGMTLLGATPYGQMAMGISKGIGFAKKFFG